MISVLTVPILLSFFSFFFHEYLYRTYRRLPAAVRSTDAFNGLNRLVDDFVVFCPIIISLNSPTLRERHWKELMKIVKKDFPLPNENPNMKLRQLMEMNLHAFAGGVEEIAGTVQFSLNLIFF